MVLKALNFFFYLMICSHTHIFIIFALFKFSLFFPEPNYHDLCLSQIMMWSNSLLPLLVRCTATACTADLKQLLLVQQRTLIYV